MKITTKTAWFLTGTDTEVGKTFIACALLHALRQRGQTALGMKPVAAGLDSQHARAIVVAVACAVRMQELESHAVQQATLAAIIAACILGFVAVMNAYPVPQPAARRILEAKGLPVPEGDIVMAHGVAIPVVILLVVA